MTTPEQHEAFRGDLLAHCYRMLGSVQEAEDLVQETLLRAWKAADRFDPRRASLRTWLHRIATNVCLTALEGRARRPLPSGLGAPGDPQAPLTPTLGRRDQQAAEDIRWLQPFPDARLGDPADAAQQRAGLRLAWVAALQLLPARQRAMLVLREVLQLSAAEVADLLDTSVASVNSGLQRARATLRAAAPALDDLREPSDPAERAVVERYLVAFEAADVPALSRLLADDVALEMPPVALWLLGRAHYAAFLERVFAMRGPGWRLVPVPANGGPALAAYAPDGRAHSLQVFTVSGGLIRRAVTFVDPGLFDLFGLPPVVDEEWLSSMR
ncbi:RNA polymerase sigma-70 factor (ECF subfamily) [Actinoplanes octamycinicus]|uniref:RNA polymerase sigma factor n=1 Tax=Actinoplanes octamycinicus TaxID=135948 RepID=A0A7W7H3N8_9ACTN|nr:RNA polymerase subunit sigma-70 [Actinoplanes octamycinicus]MBB4743292.1 RNA polymerase sigma-70 factor (ECF subfamily) [Actinoplanes octamycinicus]GIE61806.1 RNA polymerase sigma factor [Actinoplanes octamycinicus]